MTQTGPSPAEALKSFPPVRLSEIVLKTARFRELLAWYEHALGVKAFFVRDDVKEPSWMGAHGIAFIRLHVEYPYTQVLAIFEIPGVAGRAAQRAGEPGLHHMQLRHVSLEHLFLRYEALRDAGVTPVRCFNHGPSTSFYYEDPDGNVVEMSGTNFPDERDYLAYFQSEAYRRNISGIEIDPADYVGRYRRGTPQAELVRIG